MQYAASMRMLRRLALAATIALAAATDAASTAKPRGEGLDAAELAEACRRVVADRALRPARVSVAVADLSNGQWLFTHGADLLCSVASNAKLATTAAALDALGPDFAFRTTVAAVGKRHGAALHGDLLVIGRGDPSISGRFHDDKETAVLERWADAVAAAGIREVRGGIIADATYFDAQHTHPEWPQGQHSAWYCAQVGALSFNDNCILVVVQPGAKRGHPARVAVQPPTDYVSVVNRVTTSRARLGQRAVTVHRALGRNQLVASGSIRQGDPAYATWVTVHEPALFTATVFREVLARKGIRCGPARLRTPDVHIEPDAVAEILTTTSTLAQAVAVANARSQNFYAEQILKTLAREKAGKGTWPAGTELVAAFLRRAHLKGTFNVRDGCGLARANRFSARQLCILLAHMAGTDHAEVYRTSLGEPGRPGTLSHRRGLLPLRGRLRAKTGYIRDVCALSGYLDTRGGRRVAFSFLINDFRCSLAQARAAQDKLCLTLAGYAP